MKEEKIVRLSFQVPLSVRDRLNSVTGYGLRNRVMLTVIQEVLEILEDPSLGPPMLTALLTGNIKMKKWSVYGQPEGHKEEHSRNA